MALPSTCIWRGRALLSPPDRSASQRSARAAAPRMAPHASAQAVEPHLLELANELADAAARVTTHYFRTRVAVDAKKDASPVTIADREAEAAMRALLAKRVPEHAVFGEEQGFTPGSGGSSRWLWVLDPIDGTKSFITGKPLFGTLVSLLLDGEPVLGLIDQPVLQERWVGVAGRQTTLNGTPATVRPCASLADAYLYATTPHMFEGASAEAFARVRDAVRIPLYGCDCYAYGLLAAGHCDLVVEADLKPYDYMALVPVVGGAGGTITDWQGRPLRWHPEAAAAGGGFVGEVLAAGDARAHAQALGLLRWGR